MKAKSGHIIFKKGTKYSDLLPVYKDLYLTFLEETQQIPEEPEQLSVLIHSNITDLKKNRKPEGYNRAGDVRLIFPIKEKSLEFYVYTTGKNSKVVKVTEKLSKILARHGLEHEVVWDRMIWKEREQSAPKPPAPQPP